VAPGTQLTFVTQVLYKGNQPILLKDASEEIRLHNVNKETVSISKHPACLAESGADQEATRLTDVFLPATTKSLELGGSSKLKDMMITN
jgi:hypothetical protein